MRKIPFNLSAKEWQELLSIEKKICRLEDFANGIECENYKACLECIEDGEGGREFWIKSHFSGDSGEIVFRGKLKYDPYQFYLGKVKQICDRRGLYYFCRLGYMRASLWISDKPLDEFNYISCGVPCVRL